jgi:hypothetical protein
LTEYEFLQIISERIRESTEGLAKSREVAMLSQKLDDHLLRHKQYARTLRAIMIALLSAIIVAAIPVIISCTS